MTADTYDDGLGVKGLHSVPEPELDPLILLRMLKDEILTAAQNSNLCAHKTLQRVTGTLHMYTCM